MDTIMKDLEGKLHAFAEELYKNVQSQQGAQGGPGFTPPNGGGQQKAGGDDFIDVDEKK